MRDKDKHPFYDSPKWKKKRSNVLKRDNYQCRECKRFGRLTQATMVHHIYPMKDYEVYRLNNDNLLSCCSSCHNTFHDRYKDELTDRGKYWQTKVKKELIDMLR